MYRNFWHCMATTAYDLLDHAPKFDVDGLILEFDFSDDLPSHGWNWAFEDLALYDGVPGLEKTGEERSFALRMRESVNRIIDKASSKKIDVFLMGPELSCSYDALSKYPELSDPASDMMYDLPAQRLAEIFDALPKVAGIKVYLDEGMLNINDVRSSVDPSERMYRLFTSLLDVTREKDRIIIITTFTLMPHQMKAITDALKRIPPNKHLIVDNYVCPGDWGRIKLANPAIGNVGGHRELMSFDYCGEVWGQSVIPLCQAGLMTASWHGALAAGVEMYGLSGYISWHNGGQALGTLNESSIYAGQKITRAGAGDAGEIVLEWASGRYGSKAATFIASALAKSRDIVMKSWHDLGFWVQELPKSEPADIAWYNWSLHWESLAIWCKSYRPLEKMLFYPTDETVERVTAEKDEAITLVREAIADVERAKPFLSDSDYQALSRYFERDLMVCRFFRYYSEAFYRTRMFYSGDNSQEQSARAAVKGMLSVADEIESMNDDGFWICRPERARFCASQIDAVLNGSDWPEVSDDDDSNVDKWNQQLAEWGYEVQ